MPETSPRALFQRYWRTNEMGWPERCGLCAHILFGPGTPDRDPETDRRILLCDACAKGRATND